MRLIVGLGNPGFRYRSSRHNVGFQCVDLIARKWRIRLSERRPKVVLGQGQHRGHEIVLAKPRTFMNHSGEGVAYLLARFAATPSELVIIYDEMALPVGKVRIRPGGSGAGHNGVQSIIDSLRTDAFTRVRVGIGPPSPAQDPVEHVLGKFSREETSVISGAIAMVAEAVDCLLAESMEVAMNRFN